MVYWWGILYKAYLARASNCFWGIYVVKYQWSILNSKISHLLNYLILKFQFFLTLINAHMLHITNTYHTTWNRSVTKTEFGNATAHAFRMLEAMSKVTS